MMELVNDDKAVLMEQCLQLAERSRYSGNRPFVGAIVISSRGEVVGEGYKNKISGTRRIQHAERVALDQAADEAEGGILITTLEPCYTRRRNRRAVLSSCSELIVERGIQQVLMADLDKLSSMMRPGEGAQFLRQNNVSTEIYRAFADRLSLLLERGHDSDHLLGHVY
jgi:pyrimidine deaminase RibD-like protein